MLQLNEHFTVSFLSETILIYEFDFICLRVDGNVFPSDEIS